MIWLMFAIVFATLWGAIILSKENYKIVQENRKLENRNDLNVRTIKRLERSNKELLEANYLLILKKIDNETI